MQAGGSKVSLRPTRDGGYSGSEDSAFYVSDIFPSARFRNRLLLFLALLLFLPCPPTRAQQPGASAAGAIFGTVVDARDQPVAGAQITDAAGQLLATTTADGSFTVPAGTSRVQIVAP